MKMRLIIFTGLATDIATTGRGVSSSTVQNSNVMVVTAVVTISRNLWIVQDKPTALLRGLVTAFVTMVLMEPSLTAKILIAMVVIVNVHVK
jgi:hypothetical protein